MVQLSMPPRVFTDVATFLNSQGKADVSPGMPEKIVFETPPQTCGTST